jgi:hypothetical protein
MIGSPKFQKPFPDWEKLRDRGDFRCRVNLCE